MKKTTKKRVCALLLLGSMLAYSQENQDLKKTFASARRQLTEGSKTYNPKAGLAVYQELASQGNAEAMNGLGVLYLKGIAVASDEQESIKWLEKAAANGYSKAWYNLGILYKEIGNNENASKAVACFEKAANAGYINAYNSWGSMIMKGNGVSQNYPLASSIFSKGAEKGSAHCLYNLGYMYYKGFGFTQDYNLAVQQFELAAKKNDPWAMYMLGLCYRNGYGVSIDLEKAKNYLKKSAAMGVKPSQMELDDPEAENVKPNQTKTVSAPISEIITINGTDEPGTFVKVKQQPIKENISGHYSGYLLRYDWSGQNVLSRTPLDLILKQDGKKLVGEWRETAGDTAVISAEIQDDAVVFHNSKIDRTEHFYKGRLNTYEFKVAKLQLLQIEGLLFMAGNLQLYNIRERENEKPMYLILERKQTEELQSNQIISSTVVYPNPVLTEFNLSFDLAKSADVDLTIYYINGTKLYSQEWKNLNEGHQIKTLALNAPVGYYILHLIYGKEVKKLLLIKK
ncbi:T9SS type A sorting domain-containing protein [Flavobacterium foetidum]|uniref:T9SS type A sorting domain-containing protein n=1 Tax=Flavobacterium foetidum TaxID=2026681 RepID=UPI001075264C|nr:T9SS type A sorting domain-containing protein [Flavobacterium foetidum]KAF2517205.1 T9SS type A sorting domain-containing protein [Flavobacterium foetidum]